MLARPGEPLCPGNFGPAQRRGAEVAENAEELPNAETRTRSESARQRRSPPARTERFFGAAAREASIGVPSGCQIKKSRLLAARIRLRRAVLGASAPSRLCVEQFCPGSWHRIPSTLTRSSAESPLPRRPGRERADARRRRRDRADRGSVRRIQGRSRIS